MKVQMGKIPLNPKKDDPDWKVVCEIVDRLKLEYKIANSKEKKSIMSNATKEMKDKGVSFLNKHGSVANDTEARDRLSATFRQRSRTLTKEVIDESRRLALQDKGQPWDAVVQRYLSEDGRIWLDIERDADIKQSGILKNMTWLEEQLQKTELELDDLVHLKNTVSKAMKDCNRWGWTAQVVSSSPWSTHFEIPYILSLDEEEQVYETYFCISKDSPEHVVFEEGDATDIETDVLLERLLCLWQL